MAESIRNINGGTKPGTAFKIILEEYEFLDEFMKMMRKKWAYRCLIVIGKPADVIFRVELEQNQWLLLKLYKWLAKLNLFFSLRELKNLRVSWNSKWADSGVWPLISPLLSYIRNGKSSPTPIERRDSKHSQTLTITKKPTKKLRSISPKSA
jgi:hypothetical protein